MIAYPCQKVMADRNIAQLISLQLSRRRRSAGRGLERHPYHSAGGPQGRLAEPRKKREKPSSSVSTLPDLLWMTLAYLSFRRKRLSSLFFRISRGCYALWWRDAPQIVQTPNPASCGEQSMKPCSFSFARVWDTPRRSAYPNGRYAIFEFYVSEEFLRLHLVQDDLILLKFLITPQIKNNDL
jgi:hypothetical protein